MTHYSWLAVLLYFMLMHQIHVAYVFPRYITILWSVVGSRSA